MNVQVHRYAPATVDVKHDVGWGQAEDAEFVSDGLHAPNLRVATDPHGVPVPDCPLEHPEGPTGRGAELDPLMEQVEDLSATVTGLGVAVLRNRAAVSEVKEATGQICFDALPNQMICVSPHALRHVRYSALVCDA